jgi:hypothetical protein
MPQCEQMRMAMGRPIDGGSTNTICAILVRICVFHTFKSGNHCSSNSKATLMRLLIVVLSLVAIGCDQLQKKKPTTQKEEEQSQREGTDEAAETFAKDVVRRKVNDPDADFGWGLEAKRTSTEVDTIWWETTGKVTFKNKSGEKVTEKFSVTATKPLNSNRWQWVMCVVGSEAYTNAPAGG